MYSPTWPMNAGLPMIDAIAASTAFLRCTWFARSAIGIVPPGIMACGGTLWKWLLPRPLPTVDDAVPQRTQLGQLAGKKRSRAALPAERLRRTGGVPLVGPTANLVEALGKRRIRPGPRLYPNPAIANCRYKYTSLGSPP